MKRKSSLRVLQILTSVALCVFTQHAEAQDIEPPVSRFSFKTNAFDWLVTLPNFGVEFDLMKSEFNKYTVGLSAKYNWNTYHTHVPQIVFNLMDVRPEFRYYYRTRKPIPGVKHHWWDVEKHLRDRKHPRTWRAHYIGLYGNYGHYGLKFTEKGYQGEVAGLGVSAGYAIPMYEYKKGYIDVELGFALGVQWNRKDIFTHDPEHNQYQVVTTGDKFKFTPFPVLTELRVAFVWRTKSIKDKVKDDKERMRVQTHYEKIREDFHQPLLDMTKTYYDEYLVNMKSGSERKAILEDYELYSQGFMQLLTSTEEDQLRNIASSFPDEMKSHEREDLRALVVEYETALTERVADAKKEAWKAFQKEAKGHFKEVRKQQKAKAAEQKKADAEQKKADKAAGKKKGEADKKSKDKVDGKQTKSPKETKPAKESKAGKEPKVEKQPKAKKQPKESKPAKEPKTEKQPKKQKAKK